MTFFIDKTHLSFLVEIMYIRKKKIMRKIFFTLLILCSTFTAFSQTRDLYALAKGDYDTASTLQVEMNEKVLELEALYAEYTRNIL